MQKNTVLNPSEWQVMELLWQRPHTLMELVTALGDSIGWSKSTVATVLRRMDGKGIVSSEELGRARLYHPAISREAVALRETESLLHRAYRGSVGMLVSTMARHNSLTKEDIDELYEILRKAEENAK